MAKKPSEPTHVQVIAGRFDTITQDAQDLADELLAQGLDADARRVIGDAQRDLRDLRREITDAEAQIRLEATQARQQVTQSAQTMRMFGKTGRSLASSTTSVRKAEISRQQTEAVAAYLPLKSAISQAIADLDRIKATIRDGAPPARSTPTTAPAASPAPPPPPPVPPAWAADPAGRHQLRWWDGARWTEHVSDAGVQGIDPLA